MNNEPNKLAAAVSGTIANERLAEIRERDAQAADLAVAAEGAGLAGFVDDALRQIAGEPMGFVLLIVPSGRPGRGHTLGNMAHDDVERVLTTSLENLRAAIAAQANADPAPAAKPEETNLNGS